jgi:glutamate---cysteine ligase / carboxylate-amine ligase
LLPTAMHPWMNPDREMKLWPHDYSPVYEAFNRIFNCRGHGWANLQSTHWNLPFKNEEQFARLHAAIRLILPLLPGIAASSPIYDERTHHQLDCRLDVYRRNSAKIPSITGSVVPEPVYTEADYEREIYQRMYRDIAPEDPEGTLQHIWLNARGAIARFDRGAIEIRVIDIQECPKADIAIGSLMVAALQNLCNENWTSFDQQSIVPTEDLAKLFLESVQKGPAAMISSDIARHFGCDGPIQLGQLWQDLRNRLRSNPWFNDEVLRTLDVILEHGTLSQRILASIGETSDLGNSLDLQAELNRDSLHRTYSQLGDCLNFGKVFPAPRLCYT